MRGKKPPFSVPTKKVVQKRREPFSIRAKGVDNNVKKAIFPQKPRISRRDALLEKERESSGFSGRDEGERRSPSSEGSV